MPYACRSLHDLIWFLPPVKHWTAIPLFDELSFILQLLFLATFFQPAQTSQGWAAEPALMSFFIDALFIPLGISPHASHFW